MKLMTVRSAATHMGVGYSTLKQWIHLGSVRTTQTPGGHHRIAQSEIDRLQMRQSPSARKAPAPTSDVLQGLSARNQLQGYVEEVRIDGLLGQVRLRIGDQTLTAVITSDAIRALGLRRGDDALAIVKSTEVMIAKRPAAVARVSTPAKRRSKASGR